MYIVCKPAPGLFKDVFEARKASFEEGLLNQRAKCQRKNDVMYRARHVNWNCLHSRSEGNFLPLARNHGCVFGVWLIFHKVT